MRIYGMHSGRNNMSRLLARSIIYNTSKKKKNTKNNTTLKKSKATDDFAGYLATAIFILVIVGICFLFK